MGPGGPWLSGVQVPSKGTVVSGLGSKSQGHFRPVRLSSGISPLRSRPEVPGVIWVRWSSAKGICSEPRERTEGWLPVWEGARPGQARGQGQQPALQGHLHVVRPRGTDQKYPSAHVSELPSRLPSSPLASFLGRVCHPLELGCLGCHSRGGEGSLLENVMASLLLPLMTSLTRAPFPRVREVRAARGACCQLVVVQPPAAKGPDAQVGTAPEV